MSAAVKIQNDGDETTASISDVPELHIIDAKVDIINVRVAMEESCKLNKTAAIWTGIAALLGAFTSIAGVL